MTFRPPRLPAALCLGSVLGLAPAALAADEPTVMDRVNRELDDARAGQAASDAGPAFLYGGEAAFSYAHSDQSGDLHVDAWRADLKVFGALCDGDRQTAFVRVRALHDDAFGHDAFLGERGQPADDRNAVYVDRAWYRIDLAKTLGQSGAAWDARAQVGLQQVRWGCGLVLDGALYAGLADVGGRVCPGGSLWLTTLAGWTPTRDFYEFDHSKPSYFNDSKRFFYGTQLAWQGDDPGHTKVYGYFLAQEDQRDDQAARPLGVPAFLGPMPATFGYDSRYWGLGASGDFAFLPRLGWQAEGVFEQGRSMSTPMNALAFAVPQTREKIEAWAAEAQLAWKCRDAGASRTELEVLAGSGDSDRFGSSSDTLGGNAAGTRDRAFNAFGFARTGLAYDAPVSNLLSVRLGASTDLLAKELRVGADAYLFRKLVAGGASGGSTRSGADLGTELDLHAEWKVLSDLSLAAHYGVFLPGNAESDHEVRHFVFTGVRYAF